MSPRSARLESLGLRSVDGPLGKTWHPESEGALREALLEGAASAAPMAPLGAGSSVGGCRIAQAAGEAPVTWLSTASLIPGGGSGIIEYIPGDGTITAHAGAPWGALREAVQAGGHRLTPEIPGQATLGGVIAAGRSGLDRVAFGPVRHHVLGLRVMDGTGRVAQSGGRLVKNVTGFDLHRIHTGAAGTLGVILEASLRLMPIPEAEVLIQAEPAESPAAAVHAALAVRSHPGIQPRRLFTVDSTLFVGLAGRRRQVDQERGRVLGLIDSKVEFQGLDAESRSLELGGPAPGLRILFRPSNCAAITEYLTVDANFDGPLRVEPDAALIDLAPESIERLPEDFWSRSAPAIGGLGGRIDVRMPIAQAAALTPRPLPHAQWSTRLLSAFDPGKVLRIPND